MNKVAAQINRNYYKQIADKITQLLDKIHDSQLSSKRWVWELMQNAKDVPNKFGRVSVMIELWPDRLVFSHNGDHFTASNLTGLIQQVSSKDSLNEGEQKQTGKFGTGFITTHLLSNIIDVNGVVQNPNTDNFQRFTLRLDRSARKSEDMIESITNNLEWVKGLDNENYEDFPLVSDYDSRDEDSFDTSFTYYLNGDSLKAAQVGLADLVNTLPITMVSLHELKSVRVVNHVENTEQYYVCNSETIESAENAEIIRSAIDINDGRKYFLTYKTAEVALSTEVSFAYGTYTLIKRDKSQPVLFRDFPLIGSEEFHFPYMLNGFDFDPTETRSGILLNSNEPKPQKNRRIIEKAVDAVLLFNEWMINQSVHNTFLLASSCEPKPKEAWDEDYAKPWIVNLQKEWRNALLKQNLVEKDGSYEVLENIRVPEYGNKEANRRFYDFLHGFMQDGILPMKEQQDEWSEIICTNYSSWGTNLKYKKDEFFEDLQRVGCVKNLSEKLGKTQEECYDWLNALYSFVVEQGDIAYLEKYPVVPNENGNFLTTDELLRDDTQRIPAEIKEVYQIAFEKDLNDRLINSAINTSIFVKSVKEYNLPSLVNDVNSFIKTDSNTWKNRRDASYKLCNLYSSEESLKHRQEMFALCKEFTRQIVCLKKVENVTDELWREADKLLLTSIPSFIKNDQCTNLISIGEKLLTQHEGISEMEIVAWLNSYLKICKEMQYTSQLEDAIIFPNQLGDLKSLKGLRFDNEIPDEMKNLCMVAFNSDKRADLLDKRIVGYEKHNVLSTKDIYDEIKERFESRNTSDTLRLSIAREAIAIIPSTQKDLTSDCMAMYNLAKAMDSSIKDYVIVENTNGFYWNIFIAFLLDGLCKNIAESVNVKTLAETLHMSEEETVQYVDDVIEYAETRFGKNNAKFVETEHGVWINQNNDFCVFSGIRRDDNVEEDLKDLAKNEIVNIDYREQMLRKGLKCESYVPQASGITAKNILTEINEALATYVEDKKSLQDPNFAELVFKLDRLIKKNEDHKTSLSYFVSNHDKLIVGSIGDEKTLSIVGSLVSNPDKLELINIINSFPTEMLEKIANGEFSLLKESQTIEGSPAPEDDNALEVGDRGEAFVYTLMCEKYGKENVEWSNLCDESECDRHVAYSGCVYPIKSTSHDYDLKVKVKNHTFLIEVKSEVASLPTDNRRFPLYFNAREWKYINRIADSVSTSYIIARVFDVFGEQPDVYYLQQTKL